MGMGGTILPLHARYLCPGKFLRYLSNIHFNTTDMTLNLRPFVILGVLIVLVLFSAGCTQAPAPAQIMAPTPAPTAAGTAIVTA